jgi:hypothetical protein
VASETWESEKASSQRGFFDFSTAIAEPAYQLADSDSPEYCCCSAEARFPWFPALMFPNLESAYSRSADRFRFPATQEDEDSIEAGDSLCGASRGIEDSREIGTPVPGATGDAKFSGMWSFVAG